MSRLTIRPPRRKTRRRVNLRRLDPSNGQPVAGTGEPLNGIVIAGKDSPYGKRVTNNNTDLIGPRFVAWMQRMDRLEYADACIPPHWKAAA